MTLRIYNTLSRKKEIFKPIQGKRVKMFVCGPTTYDLSHLGHARTYISYDNIARYLKFKGYSVFYIMNITDVDDKIINRAKEFGIDALALARKQEDRFFEDLISLGIESVNLFPRASEHIHEIIDLVKILMKKGYAYETETGVYFDIKEFKDFGALSHQKPSELKKHRIEPDPTKRNLQDFALWKKRRQEELGWDSPWGRGRPGWHIEDTAITVHYFGPQYDVHGGAVELIFPHHEAEIAQAQAATGKKPLVKYWVHTGILRINGKKMSKSLGNFVTIREALKKYDPEVLRFFFATSHYRSIIDFSERNLERGKQKLQSLHNALNRFLRLTPRSSVEKNDDELEKKMQKCREKFIGAMNDDFNSPVAIDALFEMTSEMNKFVDDQKKINQDTHKKVLSAFKESCNIFGILQDGDGIVDSEVVDKLIYLLIELREKFREEKDWQTSDMIRSRIMDLGIVLEDGSDRTVWKSMK